MSSTIKQRVSIAMRGLMGKGIPRQIRADIPYISEEEIAEAKFFFPMEKFFIFGHARSGTTVLARLIRLHPEVHCNYQAHFFTRPPLLQSLVSDEEVAMWLNRRSNRWNQGKDLSPVILRAAADFIMEREARLEGKNIVGDKSPNSLLDGQSVHLIHKVYPDARLIYILRDGRDTIISHRFQAFIDLPQQLNKEDLKIRSDFSRNPTPFLCGDQSIFTEKGIQRAAEGWVRNVLETNQVGNDLFAKRFYILRYEDLLMDHWDEMKRIWAFLQANPPQPSLKETLTAELQSNPDADWQQQKAKQIASPLQKGIQGSWREMFTDRDRQVFHQIAGETLKAWGYEGTLS